MSTIAIVGAGPGLGLAIARKFGRDGFRVALIARRRAALDDYVAQLARDDIEAEGFVADVTDEAQLVAAFAAIKNRFGAIDVLEFSPVSKEPRTRVAAEINTADVIDYFRHETLGAVASVVQVLPDMIARGSGTILLTGGASALTPFPRLAAAAIAMAGVRNYALTLNKELSPQGIHVAYVAIACHIREGTASAPEHISELHYDIYKKRDRAEAIFGDLQLVIEAANKGTPAP